MLSTVFIPSVYSLGVPTLQKKGVNAGRAAINCHTLAYIFMEQGVD